ncbi:MAG: nucleoside-diphosphate kinase [Nanoarchaeota archaeon]
MTIERTLVLIKPDGIIRGLIGKIISKFEDTGLKIAGLKMVWPNKELAKKHYPLDEEWAKATFEKTKKSAEKENRKVEFKDHIEFGKSIQGWLVDFLTESPVVAMVIEGPHAVEIVRKIVGPTEPRQAPLGTIRGDFASIESYAMTNSKGRALRNLIHASDAPETAKREISVWFSKNEMHDYKLPIEKHF